MGRPLRLPLQVGTSSLLNFTLGFAALVPGLVVIPIGLAILVQKDGTPVPLGVGVVTVLVAVYALKRGWALRPSDVLLCDDALRVESGPWDGRALAWDSLSEIAVEEIVDHEKLDAKAYRLVAVERAAGARVVLGEADDEVEADSLRGVADAMRARVPVAAAPSEQPVQGAVLRCTNCGAPLRPEDAATVTCSYCQARVVVSHDVRTRVRAASELPKARVASAALVRRLLDQPAASSASAFVLLAFTLMALAWPFAGAALWYAHRQNELTFGAVVALVGLPFLLIADGFVAARWRLIDRRAVGALATSFAAQAPAKAGEQPTCRACGSPLGQEALSNREAVVVRCVYCGADNLTGIDLRRAAVGAQSQLRSLDEALAARNADRRKWGLASLSAVPLFALTGLAARTYFAPPPVHLGPDATALERLYVTTGSRPLPSPSGAKLLVRDEDGRYVLFGPTWRSAWYAPVYGIEWPAWMGDGFVGVAQEKGSNRSLLMVGAIPVAHTERDEVMQQVAPSPDAKRIAYVVTRARAGGPEIAIASATERETPNTGSAPLLPGLHADSPAWSPAGDELALVLTDGAPRIAIVRASAAAPSRPTPRLLTDGAHDDRSPTFDPSGNRIAFLSDRPTPRRPKAKVHDIFVMRADGSDVRRLTDSNTDLHDPAWSADGWIYFAEHGRLWRVRPR